MNRAGAGGRRPAVDDRQDRRKPRHDVRRPSAWSRTDRRNGSRSARTERARRDSPAREARPERARVGRRLRRLAGSGRRASRSSRDGVPPRARSKAASSSSGDDLGRSASDSSRTRRGHAGDPVRAEASVGVVTGIALRLARGRARPCVRGAEGSARGRDRVRTPGDRPRRARDRVGGAGAARRPRALGHGGRRDGWRSPVLAAAFHGDPSRDMQVVGITGTNGKTTTAYLLASIFEAADIRCGILGTVVLSRASATRRARGGAHDARSARRADAAARNGRSRARGVRDGSVVARAVAAARRRHDSSPPAVFTNLTRDHLDFHADMERLTQAKRAPVRDAADASAPALLNVDDPRGADAASTQAGGR